MELGLFNKDTVSDARCRFIHHSMNGSLSLSIIEKRSQDQNWFKPSGVWISPLTGYGRSEWAEWVDENGVGFDRNPHEVILETDANLLQIDSLEDLETVQQKYQTTECGPGLIDWQQVSNNYDGFLVTSYQDIKAKLRSNVSQYVWFFGLDVNGGCIWDPRAISSIKEC